MLPYGTHHFLTLPVRRQEEDFPLGFRPQNQLCDMEQRSAQFGAKVREGKHPRAVGPSSRPVGQESIVTHPEPAGAGPGPPPVPLLPWTGQEWSLSKGNVTVTVVHLAPADPSRSFPGVHSTRLQSHGSVTPAVHPRSHPRGVDTSVEANSAF